MHRPSILRILALAVGALAFLTGCNKQPQRNALQGSVTLDGQPLTYGAITFSPLGRGPRASGNIQNGRYSIESARGPLSGDMSVEIRSPVIADEIVPQSPSEWLHLMQIAPEALPDRYNTKSELRATVTDNGPNQFNFELQSK